MKSDLRNILSEIGQRLKQEPHRIVSDFDSISHALKKHHIHLSSSSLKKLTDIVTGKRKLSKDTLNRIALFAGFQDWNDFEDALHGDADEFVNFDDGSESKR